MIRNQKIDLEIFTYIHFCVTVSNLFENLTWQIVEGNEVCDLLLSNIFDNDGVDYLVLGHQVVGQLLLTELETNTCAHVLHLLFVESVHLWQIFGDHETWLTDQVDIFDIVKFYFFHVFCHCFLWSEG